MTEEVTTREVEQPEIQLQEYGLDEFIKQIEVKVNAGYKLDLETNEGYPQQYGTLYTARMLKTGNRPSVKFDVPKEPMFLKTVDEVVIPDPVDPVDPVDPEMALAGGGLIEVEPRGLETTTVSYPVKVDGRKKKVS